MQKLQFRTVLATSGHTVGCFSCPAGPPPFRACGYFPDSNGIEESTRSDMEVKPWTQLDIRFKATFGLDIDFLVRHLLDFIAMYFPFGRGSSYSCWLPI